MRIANDIELCWFFIKLLSNTLAFLLENAIADPIKSSNTIIFTGLIKYFGFVISSGSSKLYSLIYHKFQASIKKIV